jgi:hypothetical protein
MGLEGGEGEGARAACVSVQSEPIRRLPEAPQSSTSEKDTIFDVSSSQCFSFASSNR